MNQKYVWRSLNVWEIKHNYKINRYLVRGLDYYNHSRLNMLLKKKSQNTVLAGGRYNQLFASIGGKDISGVGWATGVEKLKCKWMI